MNQKLSTMSGVMLNRMDDTVNACMQAYYKDDGSFFPMLAEVAGADAAQEIVQVFDQYDEALERLRGGEDLYTLLDEAYEAAGCDASERAERHNRMIALMLIQGDKLCGNMPDDALLSAQEISLKHGDLSCADQKEMLNSAVECVGKELADYAHESSKRVPVKADPVYASKDRKAVKALGMARTAAAYAQLKSLAKEERLKLAKEAAQAEQAAQAELVKMEKQEKPEAAQAEQAAQAELAKQEKPDAAQAEQTGENAQAKRELPAKTQTLRAEEIDVKQMALMFAAAGEAEASALRGWEDPEELSEMQEQLSNAVGAAAAVGATALTIEKAVEVTAAIGSFFSVTAAEGGLLGMAEMLAAMLGASMAASSFLMYLLLMLAAGYGVSYIVKCVMRKANKERAEEKREKNRGLLSRLKDGFKKHVIEPCSKAHERRMEEKLKAQMSRVQEQLRSAAMASENVRKNGVKG